MEKVMPLISIVVITYNSAQYVLETLDSIKKQTYRNVELVISDDASKDNTVAICSDWLKSNSRFFQRVELLTVSENTGVTANCNRGFNRSSGDWIKFIAGDDILLDACLEVSYKQAMECNSDLVCSKLVYFNSEREWRDQSNANEFFNLLSPNRKLKVYCRYSFFTNTPSWLIKREVLAKQNGFDESYKMLEDQVFFLSLLRNKYSIKFLDDFTVKYRLHGDSVVQSRNGIFILELKKSFREIRIKSLSYFNFKDILYILDDRIAIKIAQFPENYFYKILCRLSPARYFKLIIDKCPNSRTFYFIKYLLS
ncbi:glycosyltransferase [Niabella sp.]|uniref:glycosyltransferase n=1 Tax=Niabella sp. TaxID=1962976 RepID=UPI0026107AF1|nr:glycosyltransferase [Niabella sp.]